MTLEDLVLTLLYLGGISFFLVIVGAICEAIDGGDESEADGARNHNARRGRADRIA